MSVQFIEANGHRQYAVVPMDIYIDLPENAEFLEDVAAYEKAKLDDDELVPSDVVYRLVEGETKIKAWREYRQMMQVELAEKCGMAQACWGLLLHPNLLALFKEFRLIKP